MGYNTGPTETPIIPVIVGNDEITFMLWKMLRDDGIFTNPVIYPAVPKEQTLIRTSYSASHTDIELDKVLSSFEKNGKKLGLLR